MAPTREAGRKIVVWLTRQLLEDGDKVMVEMLQVNASPPQREITSHHSVPGKVPSELGL